jgi:hypothetical protein
MSPAPVAEHGRQNRTIKTYLYLDVNNQDIIRIDTKDHYSPF